MIRTGVASTEGLIWSKQGLWYKGDVALSNTFLLQQLYLYMQRSPSSFGLLPKAQPGSRVLGIFAFNEARLIEKCIESIARFGDIEDLTVFVLANGCADETVPIVRALALKYSWLRVEEIRLPDKANAWNIFVHDLAPHVETTYFMDGDCTVLPQALQLLEARLAAADDALVASAIPVNTWTSLGSFRRQLLRSGGVAGNLYALPARFLRQIREKGVRMPRGLVGDDGLVGYLACCNLDPRTDWIANRVAVCREAMFAYESVIQVSLHTPSAYFSRKTRYSLRHFQNQLLGELLRSEGLTAMPADVRMLYALDYVRGLRPRLAPTQHWFDLRALCHIRQSRALWLEQC